jgi:3-(3-hydroxy-phenyl)propionate hydroxylase
MTDPLSLEQIRELIKPIAGPSGRGTSDADVVIVGAGPIGLTAANILGSLGISTLLLERNDLTSDMPRALVIDDEYIRLLDNLDILPNLRKHLSPPFGIFFYSSFGRPIIKVRPSLTPNGFGTRAGLMQPVFEKILLANAQRFDCVDLQYRSTVTRVSQDSNGVRLSVRMPSGVERVVSGRFLLGCDGARSFVRSELNIPFEGTRIDEPHLVIDLAEFPDQSPHSRFFCNPERPLNSVPTPYGGRRLEFMLNPGEDHRAIASQESIRNLFDRHSPYKGVEAKVIRSVVYGFSERIAQRLQSGRAFLLGDAAHVMPPFGAQAMNTGARDANNVCWKIAAVLCGRVTPGILETYESERRPQVEAIIRYSVTIGKLANIRSRPLALLRDAAFWALNCIPSIRRFFSSMRYMPKPWLERGFLLREGHRGSSPVGRVCPRIMLAMDNGRTTSIDAFAGNQFVLLGVGLTPAEVRNGAEHALCRQFNVRSVAVSLGDVAPPDDHGVSGARLDGEEMREHVMRHAGKLLLVRPDRYVAAAAEPARIREVFDKLLTSLLDSHLSVSSTASMGGVKRTA